MKETKWILNSYIAHRGFHTLDYPENSLEAFNHAIKNNFDIEFDLQLTKDDQIVIIHDNLLNRLCGVNKKVSKVEYDELKTFKLNKTPSYIPLFTELLDSIPATTNLMIELKTGKQYKKLVSLFLQTIANYDFNYVVQSFDPRIINLLRKKAPHITRGYIKKTNQTKCKILNILINLLPIHSWIKPNYYVHKIEDLPNKEMDKYKNQGIPILSYTAKSKQDLQFIKDRYDNAVFEGFNPNNT